jgi:formylmethanofuran dehydrogenase subunit E
MVPCGSFMVVESHVIVEQPVFELRKWLTNAKKLICKPPKQEFVYEYDSQEKLVECSECHKMKPFAVMYVENKKMLCHTCANL